MTTKSNLDKRSLLKAGRSQDVLTLWKLATRLDIAGEHLSAIKYYKQIISMNIKKIILYSNIKEKKEAYGIKNDARLRMSQCYMDMYYFKEALYWVGQHIKIRKRKQTSMYSLIEARKILSGIKEAQREHKTIQKISIAIDKRNWSQAGTLVTSELNNSPEDPWLLSRQSHICYETKRYKQALKWGKKAYAIAPSDPLYLWDYARALDMNEHRREAIRTYKKILNMGTYKAGCINTSEGLRWANLILNDSRYRIGLCYYRLDNMLLAKKWFRLYLQNRKPGISSIHRCSRSLNKLMSQIEQHALGK